MRRSSLVLFLGLSGAFSVSGADWKPVDRAELAETKPVVEAGANAEALLWEVRVEDQAVRWDQSAQAISAGRSIPSSPQSGRPIGIAQSSTTLDHYLRIKIFNNAGRDRFAKVNIPYGSSTKITNVSGRTIQPDGSILELDKGSIFDGNSEWGTYKSKSKAFAMPGVLPGSIIEYQWRETRPYVPGYQELLFQQRDLPVRLVRYFLKPAPDMGAMAAQAFHCEHTPFAKEPGGFLSTTLTNVPALTFEPYMPTEDEVKSWLLVYYRKDPKQTPQQYWKDHVSTTNNAIYRSRHFEVNREVRRIAAEITDGSSTSEEKLARLIDYCRSRIRDRSLLTLEDRNEAKHNATPADTLSQRIGTSTDIRNAFAALAIATGFDVREAQLPSRGRILSFNPGFADSYFLSGRAIAVKLDDKWRLFEPASKFLPHSMLPWAHQGVIALIADSKEPVFVRTPMAAPEQSAINITGSFRLVEDGTLEGDAVMEFTGLEGVSRKQAAERQTDEQRDAAVRSFVSSRISGFNGRGGPGIIAPEFSNIRIDNATDPEKPITYRFHVQVPNYGQRTGKRIFVAPAVFEQGPPAKFAAKERKYEISFQYPWMETDSITIDLPAGYVLDNGDMPLPIEIGKVGRYEAKAALKDGKQLLYSRRFSLGDGGAIRFPASVYSPLKAAFDSIHEADTHTITLKLADDKAGKP